MFLIDNFINKSYYDLMFEVQDQNKSNNCNIHIVVAKINENSKFIKYISSKDYYYYVHLHTNDKQICNGVKEMLDLPYEGDTRHATYKYFQN